MAKLFGEFLVEKDLATTEQVLKAVITQLRSVSSTAEVIFDQEVLLPADQLRILAHQQTAGTDYRTSAATLGFWTTELSTKVAELVQRKRRPLGEVLVDLGYLSSESLAHALDSYIDASVKLNPSEFRTDKNVETEVVSTSVPVHSETTIDPLLILEFIKNFESQVFPVLNAAVNNLTDHRTHGSIALILRTSLTALVALRASAAFVSATHTEGLAKQLILTIETASNHLDAGNHFKAESNILLDIFKMAIHIFDGICQLLKEFGSEEGIHADSNLMDLMQRIAKAQVHLRAQCKSDQVIA
jgi:hypothetical protein